jgi:hypothetical protein
VHYKALAEDICTKDDVGVFCARYKLLLPFLIAPLEYNLVFVNLAFLLKDSVPNVPCA